MNHDPPPRVQLAWEIPEAARHILPNQLLEMVLARHDENAAPTAEAVKPLHEPRVRIAAIQSLLTMHRQNQTEKPEPADELLNSQQRSRLAALARQFDVGELVADPLSDAEEASADEFGSADGHASDAA